MSVGRRIEKGQSCGTTALPRRYRLKGKGRLELDDYRNIYTHISRADADEYFRDQHEIRLRVSCYSLVHPRIQPCSIGMTQRLKFYFYELLWVSTIDEVQDHSLNTTLSSIGPVFDGPFTVSI